MNRIQLRRTSTPAKVPLLSDLLVGELGLNTVDKKLFVNNGAEIVDLTHASNIEQDSSNRFVTDAQIAAWSTPYTLPVSSASVLGGVKIGANIQVDGDGVISLNVADSVTTGVLSSTDWNTFNNKQAALGYAPVDRAGDTMSGELVLFGAPTVTNGAATKGYVDSGLAAKLDLAGGTMSGLLVLSADPTANLGAATKQYVDNATNLISGSYAAPVQSLINLSAIVSGTIQDKQMRLVEDEGAVFRFDVQSVEAADGVDVIVPDDAPATGRWIKVQSATQSHEALNNLQGGAANDHLHLTTAEKNSYDAHLANYDLHLTSAQNTWLDSVNASAVEVNYLVGVTSAIQTQLDSKQATIGYTPVNVAGDTMTGSLILAADPTAALEAATKQYCDNLTIDAGTF